MRTQKSVPGRHEPSAPPSSPDEAPEVLQTLAKAEENVARARSAQTREDRDYYERMNRKWLSIAQGCRVIADVGLKAVCHSGASVLISGTGLSLVYFCAGH
jgi:hypothetical protein